MQQEFNDPLWRTVLSGAQMLFVAFGALVLMPLITGLDPNVALFTAGLGTILFQIVTGRQVPVFLASSFAFITPIILAKGQFGLAATMGGVMAAGFVYTFLGLAVKIKGTGFIDRLLPPVVIGPVIISIGLAMAPIAANMAMGKAGDGTELIHYQTAMLISMPALLTTLIVAVFGKGIFRLVPIISGVLVGFAHGVLFRRGRYREDCCCTVVCDSALHRAGIQLAGDSVHRSGGPGPGHRAHRRRDCRR